MKRFSLFVVTLATAASTFAYYGYSSRGDSGWATFLAIITIVGCVLQIILFFKIWGMTNNVKALKKDHFSENSFGSKAEMASYLRKNLMLGNMDNVKRILLQNFFDDVEHAYYILKTEGYSNEGKWVSIKEKNLQKSIKPYVDNLIKLYAKIGEEVPVYILRMETFGDYFGILVEEDLKVDIENTQHG